MANLELHLVGGVLQGPKCKKKKKKKKKTTSCCGNKQNQLINVPLCRPAQVLTADPALVQILTHMKESMQRPRDASIS